MQVTFFYFFLFTELTLLPPFTQTAMPPQPVPPPVFDDEEPLVPRRLAIAVRDSLRQVANLYVEFHNQKYILFNITTQINSICLSPDPVNPEQEADLRRLNTELHLTRRQITEIQAQLANQQKAAEDFYEQILRYDSQAA